MNRLTKALIIISACLYLIACGQRGPLVMPKPANDTPNHVQSDSNSQSPEEASSQDNLIEEQSS